MPSRPSCLALLLVVLGVSACSGFDLGPEPEPVPDFETVVFDPSLGIDKEDFASSGGVWIRDDNLPDEDPGDDPGNGDPDDDPGNGDPDDDPNGDPDDDPEPQGPAAASGDVVHFWYEGFVFDGTPFDARIPSDGEPAALLLGVPGPLGGLLQGLTGMREGDRRTVLVPPNLGLGPRGAGVVPPNAWLVLRLEMVEVIPAPDDEG
jgi:hypothetical protein